jgi:uncharacterized paraquat-inducible protein A
MKHHIYCDCCDLDIIVIAETKLEAEYCPFCGNSLIESDNDNDDDLYIDEDDDDEIAF